MSAHLDLALQKLVDAPPGYTKDVIVTGYDHDFQGKAYMEALKASIVACGVDADEISTEALEGKDFVHCRATLKTHLLPDPVIMYMHAPYDVEEASRNDIANEIVLRHERGRITILSGDKDKMAAYIDRYVAIKSRCTLVERPEDAPAPAGVTQKAKPSSFGR